MNTVSWFLYLAKVSASFGEFFIIIGFLMFISVFCVFACPRIIVFIDDNSNIKPKPFRRGYLALAILLMVVGSLIPDRQTIYAIAASEMGEKLLHTEMATADVSKALHQWIKKQLESVEK